MNRIKIIFSLCLLVSTISNAQTWKHIGPNDLDQPTYNWANYLKTAVYNNEPYIVFADSEYFNKITVRKHTVGGWVYLGAPGFSADAVVNTNIAIDKAGTPYVAYCDKSNKNKLSVKKFDGNSWQDVGQPTISAGRAYFCSIAINSQNTPYVAYADSARNRKTIVKSFDGTTWNDIGVQGEASVSYSSLVKLVIDNNDIPYVAYRDINAGGNATVRKFVGGIWTDIGILNFPVDRNIDLTVDSKGTPFISVKDMFNDISLKTFDGTNWVDISNPIHGDNSAIIVGLNDTLYHAYIDYNTTISDLVVRKYDGTSWQPVGNTHYFQVNNVSIATGNGNTLYIGSTNNVGRVIKYNGTEWTDVATYGINGNHANHASIAKSQSGIPYTVFADYAENEKATVKKYQGGSWITVGKAGFSNNAVWHTSIFITNKDTAYIAYTESQGTVKVQKFDGTNWIYVGDTNQIGYGEYPDIAVDANNNVYLFFSHVTTYMYPTVKKFDGTSWQIVGGGPVETEGVYTPAIAIDRNGTPYVSYTYHLGYLDAAVRKFDGTSWVKIGGSVSEGKGAFKIDIAIDSNNVPYVVFGSQSKVMVKKFDGAKWQMLGNGISSGGYTTSIAIGAKNIPYIAYVDDNKDYRAYAQKYENGTWTVLDTISKGPTYGISIAVTGNEPVAAYCSYGVFVKGYLDTTPHNIVKHFLPGNLECSLYPNPAKDNIRILIHEKSEPGIITLYSASGNKIQQYLMTTGQNEYVLPVNQLSSGVYFTKVQTANAVKSMMFIKQ